MINFCTLFDSYYLDKGLALYHSLERVTDDFTLFIFCFDDKSFDILNDMRLKHGVILHHSCIETEVLLRKKKERSKAEYCWTCTPVIIGYVLDYYDVGSCTYIDSDLYFFSDPQILFDEIEKEKPDTVIVEHRFKSDAYGKKLEQRNGRYCVQFNYFCQTENSRRILKWWQEQCLDWCYDIPDPDRMGDQKYLNDFPIKFNKVHELQHLGGGVAPWNLEQYKICSKDGKDIILSDIKKEKFQLVFYHFQNIRYLPGNRVNIKSQTKDKKLKYEIYIPYLKEIEAIRERLVTEYGLSYENRGIVRSSNAIVGFLQKYFAAFKVKQWSDIINLNKLDSYL